MYLDNLGLWKPVVLFKLYFHHLNTQFMFRLKMSPERVVGSEPFAIK